MKTYKEVKSELSRKRNRRTRIDKLITNKGWNNIAEFIRNQYDELCFRIDALEWVLDDGE